MVIFTSLVILGQFPEIIVICDVIRSKQAMACFVHFEIRYNSQRKFTCLIIHNPFLRLWPCVVRVIGYQMFNFSHCMMHMLLSAQTRCREARSTLHNYNLQRCQ